MSNYVTRTFGREVMRTFEDGIKKEWCVTNGLGGYAASSIIGANTRKHHGLLIAALHAPTDRKVLLNRIDESVVIGEELFSLSSVQRKGHKYEEGYLYQTGFEYGAVPSFTYFVNGVSIKKEVAMEWEKNTTAISYEITSEGDDAVFVLAPSFNNRDHNEGSKKGDLKFKLSGNNQELDLTTGKIPGKTIRFYVSEGRYIARSYEQAYDEKIELQTEINTGMAALDTGFCPADIAVSVKKHEIKKISVVVSIEDSYCKDAFLTVQKAKKRADKIIKDAKGKDEFFNSLVLCADKFITKRDSVNGKTILAGLPWFTDWGRDTMISLTGLSLVTNRFDDAKSILKTFAMYEKDGLIPNMFPDENCEPLYNTVDASLWYFYCIEQYLRYTGDEEFVLDTLYPCLKNIQKAYEEGTQFSIGMDKEDGLIHAGGGLDQVTWMDVRVNGKVMTPRHGKPVEINALWYNALVFLSSLAVKKGEKAYADKLTELSKKVKQSFNEKFWNEKDNCLFDVVDTPVDGRLESDAKVRPNQIWAVSVLHTMLDREKEKTVVETVLKRLYVDFGLRTLPKEDPDYHNIYRGKLIERDEAYHQGTAWAFLMGGFISAYLKVNDYSKEAKEFAAKLLEPMKNHLNDGCIGGIAEVFDAEAPFMWGGCHSQAWSVAETLRCYDEVIH